MKPKLELPRFWFAMLALSLFASIAAAHSAAAQASAQTQPAAAPASAQTPPNCTTPPASPTSTDKGVETAASTVSKAANSISNLGSIFGKKKTAQNAGQVANVAGGCDAKVNAAATAAGSVAGTASSASGSGANSSSAASPATSTSAASAQPANSNASPQPQSGSAPFVPPPAATAAFVGPLDPSKMPDISGIHLGMTMPDAKAALQKLYPNARIDALNGGVIAPPSLSVVGLFRVQGDNTGHDQSAVDLTMPPNPQVVWHMGRIAPQPHVAHNVMIAALRQKYGKETLATGAAQAPTTDDSATYQMWWVFDERGQLVSGVKFINGSPFGCGIGGFLNNSTGTPFDYYRGLMSPTTGGLSTYCASSYVAVVATMSPQPILDNIVLDMVDLALAVRSAKATDVWSKAQYDKARQQDQQKSNQVKPVL
jgi:hypothetical protein